MLSVQEISEMFENETRGFHSRMMLFSKYNQSIKLLGDDFVEVYHAAVNGTICSGTGGSGWDQRDCGESKHSEYIQSRKCNNCNSKVNFFSKECPECGSENLKKKPSDARWGISSSSHFKYYDDLKEYRLMIVSPLVDSYSCNQFLIEDFVVDKDSYHLNNYARRQYESPKSNHINFQPYSRDFYLSRPKQTLRGVLTTGENYANINIDYADYNEPQTLQIPSKFKKGYEHLSEDEMIITVSNYVVENKRMGRERGNLKRK